MIASGFGYPVAKPEVVDRTNRKVIRRTAALAVLIRIVNGGVRAEVYAQAVGVDSAIQLVRNRFSNRRSTGRINTRVGSER